MVDLSKLNKAQQKAVTHTDGPLLILAGAGTGKTTVITQRVAWLIDQHLAKPDEILCLTFTDKAAGEMEERIDKLLPYGYVDLWVMTFHAFAERLLRTHAIDIGLPSDFRVLDETAQWMLVYQNIDGLPLKEYRPLGNPAKFIPDLLNHFSRLKDEGISPESYLDYVQELELNGDHVAFLKFGESVAAPRATKKKKAVDSPDADLKGMWTQEIARMKELADCYAAYQRLLRENHALDFGDLIVSLRVLFEKRPMLLEQYRRQFKYVLVDEFQDTNWSQYDFVKLLANPNNNITVVGDDDQSVYKFRGASLSNILGFRRDFPDSTQVVLTENYRSSQNILDLAYGFIQNNNPDRLEYQLQHESAADLTAVSKKLVSPNAASGIIEHLHCADIDEESSSVVKKMLELRRADSSVQWGDFAVLVRAKSHADPFLQALTLAEVPYQFLASQGLYAKPAVLDLISYLKVIDKYVESRALYRILILPTIDLANEDLVPLLHHSHKKGLSLYECLQQASALGLSEAGVGKCQTVLRRIQAHVPLARTKSVSEVAMAFIEDFGLRQYFETLDPMTQKETYDYLNHFWRLMRRFEADQEDKSVSSFLQYFELTRTSGDRGDLPADVEIGPDTVKVMTIHGSKGLEFKYVFVVNVVDKRFPLVSRKDALPIPDAFIKESSISDPKLAHIQEERRLCYVAITRAKFGLFFTSAEDYGGARAKKRSRFLTELGFVDQPAIKPTAKKGVMWGQGVVRNFEAAKAKTLEYKNYLPKSYSYTVLQTFKKCPWQFRYAHILKIPKAGSKTRSFGQSLHKALELFFNQRMAMVQSAQTALFAKPRAQDEDGAPALEDLLRYFEESWIDEWYKDEAEKKKYYGKGREYLRAFYQQYEGRWPQTIGTEKRFSIKLGGYTVTGSIDRVDKGPGGLQLFDYKSSKSPKTLTKDKKDQLVLYHIAAEEVLKEPVESLTFYFLEDQKSSSFEATEKQQEGLKLEILERIEAIQSSDFSPKPSKEVCKNCDYKDICAWAIT